MVSLLLVLVLLPGAAGGCRPSAERSAGPSAGSPAEPHAGTPPPGDESIFLPVHLEVGEARPDSWGAIRTTADPGDRVAVGPGEISVHLRLPKGTTLARIQPFLVLSPADVRFNTAEWEKEFVVDIWWTDDEAKEMNFTLKKGAPLGHQPEITLARDVTLTIERHQAPTYSIAEVGDEGVATPYNGYRWGYDLAPGKHVFRITFSKDMERGSVERAITKALPVGRGTSAEEGFEPPQPSFKWLDDRVLEVAVDLATGPRLSGLSEDAAHYQISPNDAVDREGVTVAYSAALWITVRGPVGVFRVPVTTASGGSEPIMALNPGRRVAAITPDGAALLAVESVNDTAMGDSGDAPALYAPWLYGRDGRPVSLYPQLGQAQDFGFLSDGRIWTGDMRRVEITGVTASGAPGTAPAGEGWRAPVQISRDFIFDGLAVSGDGRTFAYLIRGEGQWARDDKSTVRLDLHVVEPGPAGSQSTAERVYRDIAEMPAMADFYGPPIGMAMDQAGKTLIFNDLTVRNHRLAVVDLATGRKRTIEPPADIPVAQDIAGFRRELAISADGKLAAGVVSDQPVLVDLTTGGVRPIALPKLTRVFWSVRPFTGPIAFSPDSGALAFQVVAGAGPEEQSAVMAYDIAAGTLTDCGPGQFAGWAADGRAVFVVRPLR